MGEAPGARSASTGAPSLGGGPRTMGMERAINPTPWEGARAGLEAPPLDGDYSAEVCIVGAGVAGMSAACLLAEAGRFVVVLDAGPMGDGESARTTAHLSSVPDGGYAPLVRTHGEAAARRFAESHAAAIRQVERWVEQEQIRCGFERVPGYLFGTARAVRRELRAAQAAGLHGVEAVTTVPGLAGEPEGALCFPRQAQIHPLRYLQGLRAMLRRRGGLLFGHTAVREAHGGPQGQVFTEGGHVVKARHLLITTHTPFVDRWAIHDRQVPHRTYAIGARLPPGALPRALWWDLEAPPHYARLRSGEGGETLIVGGEDHRAGGADDAAERFARLEAWARAWFPHVGEITHRWSGQILEPHDGLALIGQNPGDVGNVAIATGFGGLGMTHGTLAGLLLRDHVLGHPNRWASLYDPSRPRVAGPRWLRENLRTAACYAAHLRPAPCVSEADIAPGSGGVMRRGAALRAVYRDAAGAYHVCSAICPHQHGVVEWNALEKTWECPCHGARFAPTGEVLSGPASEGLAVDNGLDAVEPEE